MPKGLSISGLLNRLLNTSNQKDDADSKINTSEQVNVVLGK